MNSKQIAEMAKASGGLTFKPIGPDQFEIEEYGDGFQVGLTDNAVIGDLGITLSMLWDCVSSDLHVFRTGTFGLYWSEGRQAWYLDQSVLILDELDAHTLAYACRQETVYNWVSGNCDIVDLKKAVGV
jgi:hypothetical protein